MGARTLRTDTACVALLALVQDAMKARGETPATEL
jgi:16S rRNA U1498 N3-methylase RsmE